MRKQIDVFSLVGVIFAPIGLVFLIVGIAISTHFYTNGAYVTINGVYTYCPPGELSTPVLLFGGIFGGLGLIFFILGLILVVAGIKRKNLSKKLLDTGKHIVAKVSDVELDLAVRVNRRHPFVIICEYEDIYSGKIHVFRSNDIMGNPGDIIGESINVYVDNDDWNKYYVDTDSFQSKYEYH